MAVGAGSWELLMWFSRHLCVTFHVWEGRRPGARFVVPWVLRVTLQCLLLASPKATSKTPVYKDGHVCVHLPSTLSETPETCGEYVCLLALPGG